MNSVVTLVKVVVDRDEVNLIDQSTSTPVDEDGDQDFGDSNGISNACMNFAGDCRRRRPTMGYRTSGCDVVV